MAVAHDDCVGQADAVEQTEHLKLGFLLVRAGLHHNVSPPRRIFDAGGAIDACEGLVGLHLVQSAGADRIVQGLPNLLARHGQRDRNEVFENHAKAGHGGAASQFPSDFSGADDSDGLGRPEPASLLLQRLRPSW